MPLLSGTTARRRSEFEKITQGLSDALDFSHTIGADSGWESVPFERGGGRGVLGEVDFYTRSVPLVISGLTNYNMMPIGNFSHEGLMLEWEQAMTKEFNSNVAESGLSPQQSSFYNTSAHFLWVGDRTRQLDGAHIEYFRGIRNPIGIKVGSSIGNDELINLLESMHDLTQCRCIYHIPL